MSIASRITSIEEHLKESYQELEGIGIDTTGVNNNLENIPKLLDGYWETLPKVTDEGTSITLDNTKEGKMKVLLKGNTYQETTTQSANLFDEDYYNNDSLYSINTYKYTKLTRIKERGTLYFKAQLKTGKSEIGSFYLSLCSKVNPNTRPNNAAWAIYGTIVQDGSQYQNNYATFDEIDDLYFTFYPTTVAVNTIFDTYDFLISTDNISYVPFVPDSPNPDYPQDIHTVSGDNTISVIGKNVLDFDAFLNYSNVAYTKNNGEYSITNIGSAVTNRYPLNLEPNTTYTLSCVEATNSTSALRIQIYEGSTYKYRIISNGSSEKSVTFTTDSSSSYYLNMTYTGTVAYPLLWKNVMLEKGSTATTYQEYQGRQSYNVNLPIENVLDFDTILNYWGAVYTKENGTYTLTNRGEFYARPYTLDLEVGKTYTLSGVQVAQTSSNLRLEVLKDNNIVAIQRFSPETTVSGKTFTVEEGHTYKIRGNYSTGGYPMIISKPQLEEGTKANTYTPYGTTPIELCKIGTYQDKFIRNKGKNILNRSACVEDKILTWAAGVEFNETNSLTSDFIKAKSGDSFSSNYTMVIFFYKQDKTYIGFLSGNTITTTGSGSPLRTFTIPSDDNVYYMRIVYRPGYNNSTNMKSVNIILNEGTSALDYEPYGNGDWYLNKQIGKVVLDGSEDSWVNDGGGAPYKYVISDIKNPTSNAYTEVYCDNYYPVPYSSNWNNYDYLISRPAYTSTTQGVKFKNKDISSLNDFKTWLSTHNTEVYYVLSTPTYTKIEGELANQLDKISGAKSYNQQTNISQENNDNASIMNASALQNM